jgi:hypothetical protein
MLLSEVPWSRQFLVALAASPNSLTGSRIPYGIILLGKIISTVVLKRNLPNTFTTVLPITENSSKTTSSPTGLNG